jgi:hypothetical protein
VLAGCLRDEPRWVPARVVAIELDGRDVSNGVTARPPKASSDWGERTVRPLPRRSRLEFDAVFGAGVGDEHLGAARLRAD